jgi:hypothetical protein
MAGVERHLLEREVILKARTKATRTAPAAPTKKRRSAARSTDRAMAGGAHRGDPRQGCLERRPAFLR